MALESIIKGFPCENNVTSGPLGLEIDIALQPEYVRVDSKRTKGMASADQAYSHELLTTNSELH